MTTLSQARDLVRSLLDDASADIDEQRWSPTEIDMALEAAQEEVLIGYASRGGSLLDQRVELSTTTGTLDLSAYSPLAIRGVELRSGNVYVPLDPAGINDPGHETSTSATLRVTLVAKPTFPAADGDQLTHGPGLQLVSMTRLVAIKAAQHLLPKDAEINRALDNQEARAWDSVLRASPGPSSRTLTPYGRSPVSETHYFAGVMGHYRWSWNPGAQSVVLRL